MAGDWIKVEHVTPDKPEVYRMADILGVTPEDVAGRLIRVWIWADQQSVDGNAVGVTNVTLDAVSRRDGFGAAMREVGWLGGDGKTLSFPNFERHNGETAKKRALTNKRVKRHRNASCVTDALPEKRREELKQAPPDGGPIWTESLAILTDQGLSEKTARSFLGLLCRDYEQVEVVEAVKSAVGKADAKAYIHAILKTRPRKGEERSRFAV